MNNCPFCDDDTNKNRLLIETETVKVIFSNPRLTKGHLLIMPKRHVTRPWELTIEERAEIFGLILRLQQWIAENISAGCDLRENYRPFLPQSRLKIDHIHYHLIPRSNEDDIYQKCQIYERDLFKDLPAEEVREVGSRFDHGRTA